AGVPQADVEAVRGSSFDPERERAEPRGVEPAAWCIVPLDTPSAVAATSEAIGQPETILARASAGIILGELYIERARRIDEHESLTAIDLREYVTQRRHVHLVAKQPKQDVIRRLILRMQLEAGALEPLDSVVLAFDGLRLGVT